MVEWKESPLGRAQGSGAVPPHGESASLAGPAAHQAASSLYPSGLFAAAREPAEYQHGPGPLAYPALEYRGQAYPDQEPWALPSLSVLQYAPVSGWSLPVYPGLGVSQPPAAAAVSLAASRAPPFSPPSTLQF